VTVADMIERLKWLPPETPVVFRACSDLREFDWTAETDLRAKWYDADDHPVLMELIDHGPGEYKERVPPGEGKPAEVPNDKWKTFLVFPGN
jgi:hypothetical protein